MTQITTAQAVQIQGAKNKMAAHRRIHYRPQAMNKLAQIKNAIVPVGEYSLLAKTIRCASSVRTFHHRSQPMPVDYSSQWRFYADNPSASMMQMAFANSLRCSDKQFKALVAH